MEIDQQQSPSTMTPNAFMEMLLTKMVAQLLPILHQSEQNVLLDQQLSKLTPEQNLLILLELFDRDERDDNSFILANLIVGILKNEALANEADKRLCPYNIPIFAQIDDAEMKLSVLKGLLEFGRLFMETFGIFAMDMRVLGDWRTMHWKNISITFTSYARPRDEMEAIKNALKKAGLLEAMGDEIRKNRDSLLAKAGVKRKNISRLN
ncbi:hypothetical protein GPALN_002140 [Globodera pallida]|nr:hypothetical protein GPALN_002140 [Globodera pallida]